MDLNRTSLTALAQGLRSREFSSVELTRTYLERVAAHSSLGCFITVDPERSLLQAKAADARLARGESTP